jgi:hypothetical protein
MSTPGGRAMKEKPILFSAPMVRALMNTKPGSWPAEPVDPSKPYKRMTRRVITKINGIGPITEFGNSDTPEYKWHFRDKHLRWHDVNDVVPRYKVGDILWVRETFTKVPNGDYIYRADPIFDGCGKGDISWDWTPSIFMPREAARIFLEVKDVMVEQLQDITEEDAKAEGVGKGWLENWIEQFGNFSPANWFYYDSENRYWCDKHIDRALKQFKRDVRSGKIKVDCLQGLPPKSVMEEIDGYSHDDCLEEEHPLQCETCGEPLRFSALESLIGDDFDEYLGDTWNKYHIPLIESLLCNYEKEFLGKPNIHRLMFRALWDTLNAKRGYSWDSNPCVYVYEFMRVK